MIHGTILKRPSKHCKSPYVADVLLESGEEIIAHAPSLGCCGLCEKGSIVYMIPLKGKVCTYSIVLSKQNETLVGIYPKNAEKMVETYIEHIIPNVKNLQREKKMLNSRFDFIGIDSDDRPFILEVKSVPLCENNIAYFPDGYRKKKTDVVSPRALKHIHELEKMKELDANYRCILCFVVQRDDAESFTISDKDIIYKDAILKAIKIGVEVIAIQIKWDLNGHNYMKSINII
jgi:DNA-binding sugar fermentation-stimulating protein